MDQSKVLKILSARQSSKHFFAKNFAVAELCRQKALQHFI